MQQQQPEYEEITFVFHNYLHFSMNMYGYIYAVRMLLLTRNAIEETSIKMIRRFIKKDRKFFSRSLTFLTLDLHAKEINI